MSIRDYFAAKAMEGILSNPEEFGETAPPKEIADFSFQMANAMLERRERV
jgi:hypothetical protein